MIEVEKLAKRYGPVTAVGGLTLTARPGHVTGFLGPTADWPDSLPPAATPVHVSQPGSGSTNGSAPMRHANDGHAGHPMTAIR